MAVKAKKSVLAKKIAEPQAKKVLVLRTCNADMSSSRGFVWPPSGHVEAPDWDGGKKVCGGKLHGFLWGEGDGSLANWNADAKWLVVSVDEQDLVDLGRKCGFKGGDVVFCGERRDATSYIAANGAVGKAIVGGTATAGHGGAATAGHRGAATAGDEGTATAGYRGTATAGYRGTATAGERGTATAGHRGTATAGEGGTATAGHRGTATAGDGGTATAGDEGTATAGYRGTATAGDGGTATAGDEGTATAGDGGTIVVKWYDPSRGRYRAFVAEVGENGIKKNTPYHIIGGNLVEKIATSE